MTVLNAEVILNLFYASICFVAAELVMHTAQFVC